MLHSGFIIESYIKVVESSVKSKQQGSEGNVHNVLESRKARDDDDDNDDDDDDNDELGISVFNDELGI